MMLADRLLHVGELSARLLDARADLGAHVHQDLAGVDGGKKSRPRNGTSRKDAPTKARKQTTKHGAVSQRQRQRQSR